MGRRQASIPLPAVPVLADELIGRAEEMHRGYRLLCRPETRILSLVGPPGIGKTRLGLELVAQAPIDFDWETIWVDLAPASQESEVLMAIAQGIGLSGDRPVRRSRLFRALASRRLLLFLDSFDGVVRAGPVIEDLVRYCPDLKALVTCREPLQLPLEQVLKVPPLDLPDSESSPVNLQEVAATPAVALFLGQARKVRPEFALSRDNAQDVLAICRKLDGVPLALELAAARLELLSPGQLLARLRTGFSVLSRPSSPYQPERHRSWYAAIDWSYAQLTEPEQYLLRHLSVFVGGASMEALEAVCGQGSDLMDLLTTLCRKNMIVLERSGDYAEVRVRLLGTVGEYAALELRRCHEEEESRRAHARYFAERCESRDLLVDPLHVVETGPYEAELENIRAVLSWSLQSSLHRDAILGLRVAGALGPFWYAGGRLYEGQTWLKSLLDREPQEAEGILSAPSVWAYARYMAGWIAMDRGVLEQAEEQLGKSAGLYRSVTGEPERLAEVLNRLGNAQLRQGKIQQAQTTFSESLRWGRVSGNYSAVATALNSLATTVACQRRFEQAEGLLARSLALYQSQGATWGVTFSLARLGNLARWRGEFVEAEKLLQESLSLARVQGDGVVEALALWTLGYMAYEQEKWSEAEQWWRTRLELDTERGNTYNRAYSLLSLADLKRAQKQHAPAIHHYCAALTTYAELSVIDGARRGLQGLAEVATLLDRPEAATWLATLDSHWSQNLTDPPVLSQIRDVAEGLVKLQA
jgi:predicted ATPase